MKCVSEVFVQTKIVGEVFKKKGEGDVQKVKRQFSESNIGEDRFGQSW